MKTNWKQLERNSNALKATNPLINFRFKQELIGHMNDASINFKRKPMELSIQTLIKSGQMINDNYHF